MTDLADRYRLGDLLGRGGVADVYRARDLVLDRDVAVKMLRESVDDNERSRFVAEATTLARLAHPGVVIVLDVGVAGSQPYLVMELVDGPTLATRLRDGALPPPEVAHLGAQLAAAVASAHEQGAIHRDVKPANVLLGPTGVVKLADFGIARLIGDTVHHTRTGTTVGTPAYASPEQVQGAEVGPPTDVYSLGLVLLEALTGDRAFPGTPMESALARVHRTPSVPDDVPAEWAALLGAMTATDPGGRPTAAEAAARLRELAAPGAAAAAVPADAPAPTQVLETAPAVAVRRPLKAVGAVVAVALVVVALAVAGQLVGGRDDDDPAAPVTTPATSSEPATSEPTPTADATSDDVASTAPPAEDEGKGEKKGNDDKVKDKEKDKGSKNKGGKGKGGKG